MRRDLTLAGALALLLLAILPAYGRVFADEAWRGPVVAAGLLALVVAAGVRRLGGGALISVTVSTAALVLFTYVTALPDVGLLPDTSSWTTFRDLIAQAAIDLRETPAPAPSTSAFVVALTTGTWLILHGAHEVLVRWRMPGAALVPPLVLWSLPLAIPLTDDGVLTRALPFLAAAGLILLLGTDDGEPDDRAPRATVSGFAVGAGALALAVAAPLLLPSYGAAALVDLTGQNDPRGYQPIVDISERLQQPGERDVLQVRTSQPAYLRLAGLDSFDGATWRLGPGSGSYRPDDSELFPADRELPPEERAAATTPVRTEIEVLDLANIYVPTPYQPEQVLGPFRDEMVWSTEGGFLATWNLAEGAGSQPRVGVTDGVEYAVEAQRPTPDIEQLREVVYDEAALERWTALPRGYDALASAAEEIYADVDATTAVDQAFALQDWFTGDDRFTYDLDVPALRGDGALQDFVLEDRVGYCEYFATAMAVMLRASGVPARVAVGFLPGEVTLAADPEDGRELTEYTVTTDDAHAWVEVLFPGYGWVTFEPTPRDDQTEIRPTEQELAPIENVRERTEREQAEQDEDTEDTDTPETPGAATNPARPDPPEGQAMPDGADVEEQGAGGAPGWPLVLAGLLGLAVVAAVVVRRRSGPAVADGPLGRVLRAQRRLFASARRLGVGRAPQETTTEVVRRWRGEGRVGDEADRFALLSQRAAFGGDVDDAVAAEAERLVAEIAADLRSSVPARERTVAPVRVPAQTLATGARRAGDRAKRTWRREPPH